MHAQIGHNIPEPTYVGGNYPYSISIPNMYSQNSFPYANNTSSSTHGLSHVSTTPQQAYPGISMPSYQIEHNQYVSNINQTKPHTSGSSTADSNTSNGSEFDINRNPVKKRRKPAPTIATGRRNLKNETMFQVAPEEAERRIKRRERNRKSAQRCRERKIEKKETLQKEINDINQKSRRYLDLAESILKAWKDRLRFLEDKLPGNNFKSQLSVMEFEQLIEACSCRNNETSEAGDTCSPRSSVVDPSMMNPIKQEYVIGPSLVGQNASNNSGSNSHNSGNNNSNGNNNNNSNSFMTCPKVEQYYPANFASDLLPPNVVNSGYDQYHHPYSNDNGISYI